MELPEDGVTTAPKMYRLLAADFAQSALNHARTASRYLETAASASQLETDAAQDARTREVLHDSARDAGLWCALYVRLWRWARAKARNQPTDDVIVFSEDE